MLRMLLFLYCLYHISFSHIINSLNVASFNLIKKIERSVSLILGILGILDHFRHSFITLYQPVIARYLSKEKYDKVELGDVLCMI